MAVLPRKSSPGVLPGIGLLSGFFSALFGAGTGSIVVPLLVLRAGFTTIQAAGTSLAAMLPTTAFAVAAFALLGAVEWDHAILLGAPAAAGAVVGVWLQRRTNERAVRVIFACFLLVMAGRLLVG
jgi:uncharacterized membrane protein YfcA